MNRAFSICLLLGCLFSETAMAADSPTELLEKAQSWWAFKPVRDPSPPGGGGLNPIDSFLRAGLKVNSIGQSAPAGRRTLIRRASFDLIGLPPTPAEIEAFLADDSPAALERVVDRLLASPAYGPRWARHWLDVVRYADYHDADPKARTTSCEPLEAWRYRDWVVDSFNSDLPFDQFIVHQIAGDLLPAPDGSKPYPAGLIATGFLVNGAWDRGDADKEKLVSDMVDDQIDTVGKAFLGLTLGCARCHDHKFDPVSTRDYYALAGIFYSTHIMENLGAKGGEITLKRVPLVLQTTASAREAQLLQLEAVKTKLASLDKLVPKVGPNHPERLALEKERDQLEADLPAAYPVAIAAHEGGMPGGLFPNIQDVPIHLRGSYTRPGPLVQRRMPEFFAGTSQPPIQKGSGRRELAAWIASPANPLTARVIVNRVWQWHFGHGLVKTPNNFGLLSEPPSHPELLDWLTSRFLEDGWSMKQLHRRILLTEAYQRKGTVSVEATSRDPENRWLGRYSPWRLEAEAIRDSMLFVAGKLDFAPGGPAVPDLASPHRSLYVQTARWDRSNFATLFDAANPDASVERRDISTVAPQALFLINNAFVQKLAGELARQIVAEASGDTDVRIDWVCHKIFGRPAFREEKVIARRLLESAINRDSEAPWHDLAHVLLCSNEFIYVD